MSVNNVYDSIDKCPLKYEGKTGNHFIDITGQTYNSLTVLWLVGFHNQRAEWLCKCNQCGKYVIVNSHNLRTGHTKTCGCAKKDISKKLRKDKVGNQYGYLKVLSYDCSKNEMPYYMVKCLNCGRIYSVNGHSLERQYSCGCIRSKNANKILRKMRGSDIMHIKNVEIEKTFDDCIFRNRLKFDFYIPQNEEDGNQPILIEYDGEQHYRPIIFSNSISEQEQYRQFISCQVRDWYKDFYAISHNIPLIRIKYSNKKNPTYKDLIQNGIIIGRAQGSDDRIDIFGINDTDFVNYKEPTFNIAAGISCTFKCCPQNPELCINHSLNPSTVINHSILKLIERYDAQDISKTITFQGLESLDNIKQILWFIYAFRKNHKDTIIVWTGYTKEECEDFIYLIKDKMHFPNIIMKFGRYIPDQQPHYDPVLGVNLASDNQYAEKIS